MRRIGLFLLLAIGLTLSSACNVDRVVGPGTDADARSKRADEIENPPDPDEAFLLVLWQTYDHIQWKDYSIEISGSGTAFTSDPIYGRGPAFAIELDEPLPPEVSSATFTISVPAAALPGDWEIPKDYLIYKTRATADLGGMSLTMPCGDWFDLEDFDGRLDSFWLIQDDELMVSTSDVTDASMEDLPDGSISVSASWPGAEDGDEEETRRSLKKQPGDTK